MVTQYLSLKFPSIDLTCLSCSSKRLPYSDWLQGSLINEIREFLVMQTEYRISSNLHKSDII